MHVLATRYGLCMWANLLQEQYLLVTKHKVGAMFSSISAEMVGRLAAIQFLVWCIDLLDAIEPCSFPVVTHLIVFAFLCDQRRR